MRIVGGEFRGRPLAVPKSNEIRPTADRTRESLFNILSHAYPECVDGTRILDLLPEPAPSASKRFHAAVAMRSSSKTASRAGRCFGRTSMRSACTAARASCAAMQPISAASAISKPSTCSLPTRPMARVSAKGDGGGGRGRLAAARRDCGARRTRRCCRFRASFLCFLESRIFGDTRVHFFRYQPQ